MSPSDQRWLAAARKVRDVGRVVLEASSRLRSSSAGGSTASSVEGSAGGSHPAEASVGYAPVADDRADPGEVVWAWVPFEEDPDRGKDRPVLVIGRESSHLLALQLTSKDHDVDATQEAAEGRYWVDIGTGAWDRRRRPSEARTNRLLRLGPHAVRRTGARLDRAVFEEVVAAVRQHYPGL